MKPATAALSNMKHYFVTAYFSLQVITACAALPLLFGIGISYNAKETSKYVIVKTNKGKVSIELKETDNKHR